MSARQYKGSKRADGSAGLTLDNSVPVCKQTRQLGASCEQHVTPHARSITAAERTSFQILSCWQLVNAQLPALKFASLGKHKFNRPKHTQ
jgi:hypothetical protein